MPLWTRDRRDYQLSHICHRCQSLVPDTAEICLDCEVQRPPRGWLTIGEVTPDVHLGRVYQDRYMVTKLIGHGAVGRVYRAESLMIPRRFAIKVISIPGDPTGREASEARERIRRETNAVLSLRNPHIIRIYDIFDVDARNVAIVMDFVQGETLQHAVESNGPLGVRRAIRLARQIANGLFEAHESGLIHRDVKPENIMVEQLPAGDDFVHILDFGIVWARGRAHVTDGFVGTPLYASPDQALGEPLDPRCDIYSLGATLFYVLSGRPPFEGTTPMKILHDHVSTPPPSLLTVRDETLGLAEMDHLIQRMLAKDRNNRPTILTDVIDALDAIESDVFHSGSYALIEQTDANPPPETSSCSGCVTRKPASDAGRDKSDVACMTEFSIPARGQGRLVAAFSQSRFGMLDAQNRITWGSLLLQDMFEASTTLSAEVLVLALSDKASWVGTQDGRVLRLEDPDSTGHIEFSDHSPICAIACDPSEWVTAVATRDGRVFVRRSYLSEDWRLVARTRDVTALAVSPTGKQLAIGHADGQIDRWFVDTLERDEGRPIEAHERVERIAISNDEFLIAALTAAGQVVLEAPQAGTTILELGGFAEAIQDIAFSKHNTLMALSSDGDRVFVLDLQCKFATQCTPESTFCDVAE